MPEPPITNKPEMTLSVETFTIPSDQYWRDDRDRKHRLDGPAMVGSRGGSTTQQWWIDGEILVEVLWAGSYVIKT